MTNFNINRRSINATISQILPQIYFFFKQMMKYKELPINSSGKINEIMHISSRVMIMLSDNTLIAESQKHMETPQAQYNISLSPKVYSNFSKQKMSNSTMPKIVLENSMQKSCGISKKQLKSIKCLQKNQQIFPKKNFDLIMDNQSRSNITSLKQILMANIKLAKESSKSPRGSIGTIELQMNLQDRNQIGEICESGRGTSDYSLINNPYAKHPQIICQTKKYIYVKDVNKQLILNNLLELIKICSFLSAKIKQNQQQFYQTYVNILLFYRVCNQIITEYFGEDNGFVSSNHVADSNKTIKNSQLYLLISQYDGLNLLTDSMRIILLTQTTIRLLPIIIQQSKGLVALILGKISNLSAVETRRRNKENINTNRTEKSDNSNRLNPRKILKNEQAYQLIMYNYLKGIMLAIYFDTLLLDDKGCKGCAACFKYRYFDNVDINIQKTLSSITQFSQSNLKQLLKAYNKIQKICKTNS